MLFMPGSVLVANSLKRGVYNRVRGHKHMNKQNELLRMAVSAIKKITAIAETHPWCRDHFL